MQHLRRVKLPPSPLNVRFFNQTVPLRGGYIEEAQLAMYGAEVFRDIHAHQNIPKDFKIAHDDERYPELLRGFDLGVKVIQYRVLDDSPKLHKENSNIK